MDVHLKVLIGGNAGTTIRIVGPKFFIGRSGACQLRPRSEAIGRLHCMLVFYDDYVTVCDLHSRNGTYVNGQRIESETRLESGDHLKIGPLEFEVVIKDDHASNRHAGTAKISVDETDPAEGPRRVASGEPRGAQREDGGTPGEEGAQREDQPGDSKVTQKTDEAAAQALRRLRRFRST
jgi:pSer/pThr/pTyr-binding forkhead associated (FHA) protein